MKKRLTGCLLAVLLLAASFPAHGASAARLTIGVPETMPAAGERFSVTVSVAENPGLCSVQFTLAFDRAAMECTDIVPGEALSGALSATNGETDTGAMLSAASLEPLEADGVLAVFQFRADEDITEWKTALRDVCLSDADGTAIPFTAELLSPAGEPERDVPTEPAAGGEPTASVKPTETAAFRDTERHWCREFAEKAADRGLFTGYPDGTFRPDVPISRADFVTVLWRSAGSPEPKGASGFADVPEDAYYAKAVAWAKERGCVNGVSAAEFRPQDAMQRQAAVKILYYDAGGVSGMEMLLYGTYEQNFTDSGAIASWAKAPMYWAYFNGILSGTGASALSPAGTLTRGEAAKILVCYSDYAEAR